MNKQSNNKVLILLIVVLFITNLGMLWYFTREHKEEVKPLSRTERMAEVMRKELNFDDAQVAEYISLRGRRDSIMKPLNEDLRVAKIEFLNLLHNEAVPDSLVLKAAQNVAMKQVPIEVAFFHHFKRIQAICNPSQVASFDSMLVRMVQRNTGDTTTVNRPN